jgi:hypothetical protein
MYIFSVISSTVCLDTSSLALSSSTLTENTLRVNYKDQTLNSI